MSKYIIYFSVCSPVRKYQYVLAVSAADPGMSQNTYGGSAKYVNLSRFEIFIHQNSYVDRSIAVTQISRQHLSTDHRLTSVCLKEILESAQRLHVALMKKLPVTQHKKPWIATDQHQG